MALIDVSELMSDPDFVDEMVVVTRTPFVNSRGENTFREVSKKSVGSVQPSSGETVARLPEALRTADVKSFWFKGEIVASGRGKYSTVLIYQGKRFEVQAVFDWSNFGEGYSEGVCVAELPA